MKKLILCIMILLLTGCFENSGYLTNECTKKEISNTLISNTTYKFGFKNNVIDEMDITYDYQDEVINTISSLKSEGASINSWGVGTKLITSAESPSLGGVYKLAASIKDDILEPKIKLSENPEKISNPGFKKVIRIYNENMKAEADLIMLHNEVIDTSKPLTIFHPTYTWITKTFDTYTIKELLQPLFIDGKSMYKPKKTLEVRSYVNSELNSLWDQYRRIVNPSVYKVDLSQELWDLRTNMIDEKKSSH